MVYIPFAHVLDTAVDWKKGNWREKVFAQILGSGPSICARRSESLNLNSELSDLHLSERGLPSNSGLSAQRLSEKVFAQILGSRPGI